MSRKPRPSWSWIKGITRTDFLVDGIGATMSLQDLLANAYLQGLIDASEVVAMRADKTA